MNSKHQAKDSQDKFWQIHSSCLSFALRFAPSVRKKSETSADCIASGKNLFLCRSHRGNKSSPARRGIEKMCSKEDGLFEERICAYQYWSEIEWTSLYFLE
jgi:hypothetical protein